MAVKTNTIVDFIFHRTIGFRLTTNCTRDAPQSGKKKNSPNSKISLSCIFKKKKKTFAYVV